MTFAKRHLKKELVRSFPIQVKENNTIVKGDCVRTSSLPSCSLSGDKHMPERYKGRLEVTMKSCNLKELKNLESCGADRGVTPSSVRCKGGEE